MADINEVLNIVAGRASGDIAERLTEEARVKLTELASRAALLNCEFTQVVQDEATRLATSPEEFEAILAQIISYYSGLSNSATFEAAPEKVTANSLSM